MEDNLTNVMSEEKDRLEEVLAFDFNGRNYRVYYTHFDEKLFFVACDGKILPTCVAYDAEAFIKQLAQSPERFPQDKIETVMRRIIIQPLRVKGQKKTESFEAME